MDTSKAIEAFEKKCGTLEDYQGNKEEWRADFGLFCIGWLASEEAAEHSVQRTGLGATIAGWLFEVQPRR